jgi:hypothetical protein
VGGSAAGGSVAAGSAGASGAAGSAGASAAGAHADKIITKIISTLRTENILLFIFLSFSSLLGYSPYPLALTFYSASG